MSSFEWVELETLTSDIETARSRLADARKRNNQGAVAMLETEITRAEKRRSQLLAHISTNVATSAPEPARRATAKEAAGSRQTAAPVEEAVPDATSAEPPSGETAAAEPAPLSEAKEGGDSGQAPAADAAPAEAEAEQPVPDAAPGAAEPIVASGAASPASALKADGVEGGMNMWNQLTPNDIERAKHELDARRAEMLARHAEEMRGLAADQSQLETLEQAIESFLRKFNPAPESAVVKLDQERELRQQGNS